jgi:hypothetical protein
MAKPSETDLGGENLEAIFIRRLARLACWRPEVLRGLTEGRHQGPRQKLQDWQIIAGLAAQSLHAAGSLQHLIRRYFAVQPSSSALSQRRQHMQMEPFATVMRHALRPMAPPPDPRGLLLRRPAHVWAMLASSYAERLHHHAAEGMPIRRIDRERCLSHERCHAVEDELGIPRVG